LDSYDVEEPKRNNLRIDGRRQNEAEKVAGSGDWTGSTTMINSRDDVFMDESNV
jgi:hypothetical protein